MTGVLQSLPSMPSWWFGLTNHPRLGLFFNVVPSRNLISYYHCCYCCCCIAWYFVKSSSLYKLLYLYCLSYNRTAMGRKEIVWCSLFVRWQFVIIGSRMSVCGQTPIADRCHLRTTNHSPEFLPITYTTALFFKAGTSLFRFADTDVRYYRS